MILPLVILYEISILLSALIYRKKKKKEAEEEEKEEKEDREEKERE